MEQQKKYDIGLMKYSAIAKWYGLYVKNGFDSLQPSGRSDVN